MRFSRPAAEDWWISLHGQSLDWTTLEQIVKISPTSRSELSCRSFAVAAAAALIASSLFSPTVAQAAAPQGVPAFAAGRILVESTAGVADTDFDAVVGAHGGKSKGKLKRMNTHVVDVPVGSELEVVEALRRNPHVKFAELDHLAYAGATTNDPLLSSEWHLTKISALNAWNTSNGAGTIIAILDTGIDPTHPDLASQLVPGWNFYSNNADTSDVHGHGTAVAGAAAAASNNGTGVASVAWGARLMPVRIADANAYAYWSTVAQGLTWAADNGARVANISYVGVAASSTVQSAAQYMRNKGGVVAVCAGNNAKDEGIASTDTMIVVSATDSNDVKASWSSWGTFVDLAAPGQSIYTTSRGGSYAYWSGTSLATPVVAGVAALIKAKRPDFTAAQIESALFSSAVDLGAYGRDSTFGFGRVNAEAALAATASLPADTTAPMAAITAPTGGTVSGSISVNVNASDNVGVMRVDLKANGVVVATDTTAPFSFVWNSASLADGAASLAAVAYDGTGNIGNSAPVSVTVANAAPTVIADTTPPVVTITNPANGTKISNKLLTVTASATDAGGLSMVKLLIDGVVVASGNTSSVSYKWNTRNSSAGTHTITVQAQDTTGNQAAKSVSVTK
jgi:subtilisin family serine protease